jgi:hypothetical protein
MTDDRQPEDYDLVVLGRVAITIDQIEGLI